MYVPFNHHTCTSHLPRVHIHTHLTHIWPCVRTLVRPLVSKRSRSQGHLMQHKQAPVGTAVKPVRRHQDSRSISARWLEAPRLPLPHPLQPPATVSMYKVWWQWGILIAFYSKDAIRIYIQNTIYCKSVAGQLFYLIPNRHHICIFCRVCISS